MDFRSLRLIAAAAAALTLAACQTQPVEQKLPVLSFTDKPEIRLDVGQLEIVPEYVPPGRSPNVEHLMPVSPEAAVVRWAQDRLRPMGRSGYARVLIKDARVTETSLKTDKGVTGLFKEEQAERYDAVLDVVVQIQDERHFTVADATARATRSRTVAEGITLNERDRVWYELSEALVHDMDAQLDGLIRTYLAKWVLN